MADNILDDDLTSDSIPYVTLAGTAYEFMVPPAGFSTPSQKKWSEEITRKVITLTKENQALRSQVTLASTQATATAYDLSRYMEATNEAVVEPLEAPSTPIVNTRMGQLEVKWDGSDHTGLPMGNGFSHINIYTLQVDKIPDYLDVGDLNFNLDSSFDGDLSTIDDEIETEALDFDAWPPTSVGTLTATSTETTFVFSNLAYNKEYLVWFIAFDLVGNQSPASETVSVTVKPLVDTDIIGRILDGANMKLSTIDEALFDEDFRTKITTIEGGIVDAQTSADAKSTVWYRPLSSTPPTPNKNGDTWFVTDEGNRILTYEDGFWQPKPFGTDAIDNLAITDAKIGNLDAAKITTGTLSADRIGANSITAAKIAGNTITAAEIASLTITANELAANSITAGKIAANAVQAGNISANAVEAGNIKAGAIDGMVITGATVRTSSSGNRTQMDTVGLRTFWGGTETARLSAQSGGLALTGKLTNASTDSRVTIGDGRVEIDDFAGDSGNGPAYFTRSGVFINRSYARSNHAYFVNNSAGGSTVAIVANRSTLPDNPPNSYSGAAFIFLHGSSSEINLGATTVTANGVNIRSAAIINSGTLAAARLPAATESAIGAVERATQAEVNAGTDTTRYVTPATLRNSARIPFNMEAGTVAKQVVAAGAQTSIDITFPTTVTFTKTPVVTATAWGAARDTVVQVDNVTTTGCTIRLSSLATVSRTVGAHWTAVQMAA